MNNYLQQSDVIVSAMQASQIQDWASIIVIMQNLPVDRSGKSFLFSDSRESEHFLDLALQVLRSEDFQQQWEIAKLFPKFGEIALQPLIKIAIDLEAGLETRWHAVKLLAEFDSTDSIFTLVEILKNAPEEELSSLATQSLANTGKGAIEALKNLLKEESTRLSATIALAHIRHSETIEPLLTLVEDSNGEIRLLAIEALGSFHNPKIPPILIKALKDVKAAVRKEAAIALGMRADLATELNLAPTIAPLLYDLNLDVCRQAAIALGRMGSKDAAIALFEVLQAPLTPTELKIEAVRSLAWNGTETALECLRSILLSNQVMRGSEVLREIVAVLGRNLPEPLKGTACSILLEFFEANREKEIDPQLKQVLAMSLGELRDKRAIEILLALAAEDDRSVSLHAKAALEFFHDLGNDDRQ